ncbi:hypothetical protein V1511DRAFT_261240 [Dipodascopsis uninucleata]
MAGSVSFLRSKVFFRRHKKYISTVIAFVFILLVIKLSVRDSGRSSSRRTFNTAQTFQHPKNKYMPSTHWKTPYSYEVSSSVDIDTVVLPPMESRCPIYAFFDPERAAAQGLDATKEKDIIAVWRQAFWAAGFQPVILDLTDAKKSNYYSALKKYDLKQPDYDLALSILAWSSVPDGVLTDYRLFPMTISVVKDEFKKLRSCRFAEINRFKDTGNNLLFGSNKEIQQLLHIAFDAEHQARMGPTLSQVAVSLPDIDSFAHYTPKVVSRLYKNYENQLPALINAHLHTKFLSRFPEGILVVDPFPDMAHTIIYPSYATAKAMAKCPPYQDTCPPNSKNGCFKCTENAKVYTRHSLPESIEVFTILPIPHPLSLIALQKGTIDIDPDMIRRETERDQFVKQITSDIFKLNFGAAKRVLSLKEYIEANSEILDTILVSIFESQFEFSECLVEDYTRWALGFNLVVDDGLPATESFLNETYNRNSNTFVPSTIEKHISLSDIIDEMKSCLSSKESKLLDSDMKKTLISDVKVLGRSRSRQRTISVADILTYTRDMTLSEDRDITSVRLAAESWHLADAELWRFVKWRNYRLWLAQKVWQ